jgi:hypothetical protein
MGVVTLMMITVVVFGVFKVCHKVLKVLNHEKEQRQYIEGKGNPDY